MNAFWSHKSSSASISLTHSSVNKRAPFVLRNHITPMFIAAWQMCSSKPSSSKLDASCKLDK